jgi:hypothetical protein
MGHLQVQFAVGNLFFPTFKFDMTCPADIDTVMKAHTRKLPKGSSKAKYAANQGIITIFVVLKA